MAMTAARQGTASLDDQRASRAVQAFTELPKRYLGATHGLRRRLPDPARRRRPHLGGAGQRRPLRRAPVAFPRARRRHRHRRVDLAGAARGSPLGPRRLRPAAPVRARRPRSGARASRACSTSRTTATPCCASPTSAPGSPRSRSLIAGHGAEQVVCLHGLGSNKASFFETISALAPDHTVHALDLPGLRRLRQARPRSPTTRAWFATVGARLPGRLRDRARPPGRQLDGRPDRDRGRAWRRPSASASLSLLTPALAFRRRQLAPLVQAAAPGARADPAPADRTDRPRPVLEPVRPARAPRSGRRGRRRRRVLPPLPLARRANRVLRRRPQHLPRRAARRRRLLRAARRARAAGAVRLGRHRPPDPSRVLAPRRRGAAGCTSR